MEKITPVTMTKDQEFAVFRRWIEAGFLSPGDAAFRIPATDGAEVARSFMEEERAWFATGFAFALALAAKVARDAPEGAPAWVTAVRILELAR